MCTLLMTWKMLIFLHVLHESYKRCSNLWANIFLDLFMTSRTLMMAHEASQTFGTRASSCGSTSGFWWLAEYEISSMLVSSFKIWVSVAVVLTEIGRVDLIEWELWFHWFSLSYSACVKFWLDKDYMEIDRVIKLVFQVVDRAICSSTSI